MQLLSLDSIHKQFGDRTVLGGISLELCAGECLALLGPNGAGKSTTIKIALGLTQPTSGAVEAMGFNMLNDSHRARFSIGVVPQYDALDPDFSVRENLEVFAGYFGISRTTLHERVEQLLLFSALQSREHSKVDSLSGGMRRRLSLARALVSDPQLLFLDEPTTALDPQAKHLIWERVLDLKRQGKGILLTTHFMDEAERLADRVAILDGGRIIASGLPQELISEEIGGYVLEIWADDVSKYMVDQLQQVEGEFERRGETYVLKGDSASRVFELLKVQNKFRGRYLYRPANLEDVFFKLTGRDLRDA